MRSPYVLIVVVLFLYEFLTKMYVRYSTSPEYLDEIVPLYRFSPARGNI